MSNRIIRFGGSSIGNTKSIQNLQTYIGNRNEQRTFIVVSSAPKLLQIIEDSILGIFNKQFDSEQLKNKLIDFILRTLI